MRYWTKWSLCILASWTQAFVPCSHISRASTRIRYDGYASSSRKCSRTRTTQLKSSLTNNEDIDWIKDIATEPSEEIELFNDGTVESSAEVNANATSTYYTSAALESIPILSSNKQDLDTVPSKATIFNAVCLVIGTAIGGGFLALPSAVLPIGFYPSFTALCGTWVYLLALSHLTVESILKLHQEKQNKKLLQRDDDTAASESESSMAAATGLLAVSNSVFGTKANAIIASMMTFMLHSILVIQISRAGLLFPKNYRLAIVTAVMSLSGLVFGTDRGLSFASKSNSILTTLFCLSASALFGVGLQSADWTRLHAGGSSMDWSKIPAAFPVFLYTMVYAEILPTLCELLNYKRRPIQIAVLIGSLVTMGLLSGWAALATALIPAGGATIGSIDPVAILLSTPGMVRLPLLSLSVTAILTTIIGGYLALLSSYRDILGNKIKGIQEEKLSLKVRMKLGALIAAPSMLVAASSPTIFLHAICFSGKYPVLILVGILPPIISFLQRLKDGTLNKKRLDGSLASLLALELISLTMLAVNIKNDLAPLLIKIFGSMA